MPGGGYLSIDSPVPGHLCGTNSPTTLSLRKATKKQGRITQRAIQQLTATPRFPSRHKHPAISLPVNRLTQPHLFRQYLFPAKSGIHLRWRSSWANHSSNTRRSSSESSSRIERAIISDSRNISISFVSIILSNQYNDP